MCCLGWLVWLSTGSLSKLWIHEFYMKFLSAVASRSTEDSVLGCNLDTDRAICSADKKPLWISQREISTGSLNQP